MRIGDGIEALEINATKEDIENEVKRSSMKGFDRFFLKLSFKTFLKSGVHYCQ